MTDLFPSLGTSAPVEVATYDYLDETGRLLYQVVRYFPKDFRQRRPNASGGWTHDVKGVRRVPYRLPEVRAAADAQRDIFVVEGEKDVEALERLGATATCNSGGAGKWRREYASYLRGCPLVAILPDNDGVGRHHASEVATSLFAAGIPTKIVHLPDLPEKGDVTDWLAQGGTLDRLQQMRAEAPFWRPSATVLPSGGRREELAETYESRSRVAFPSPLRDVAFHGPLGQLVRLIEPHTEADPAGLLVQALALFGNVLGRRLHFVAEGEKHFTNLFVCLVGETSKGRKGSSLGQVRGHLTALDAEWESRLMSGVSSGEGLIWQVRDASEDSVVLGPNGQPTRRKSGPDQGVQDKRLVVVQTEMGTLLNVLSRDGNTVSPVLREAWDGRDLRSLITRCPVAATGAFVSFIGHVTRQELVRGLKTVEMSNGFANRFLWVCVRRANILPDGGAIHTVDFSGVRAALTRSVTWAREAGLAVIERDSASREIWHRVYPTLSAGRPGMLGSATSRAEAQVMRLALIYAVAAQSPAIHPSHLEAALEVWRYAFDSARFTFGETVGEPLADAVLGMLRDAGSEGLSRNALRDAFARNRSSKQFSEALDLLESHGLVRQEREATGGRPAERYFYVGAHAVNAESSLPQAPPEIPRFPRTAVDVDDPQPGTAVSVETK